MSQGYATACHAGAAFEGLCYKASGAGVPGPYDHYYLNTTSPNGTEGLLIWELPYTMQDGTIEYEPSAMELIFNVGSNVAVAQLSLGLERGISVSLSPNGTFYFAGGLDDSANTATGPSAISQGDLTNWNLCYQDIGFYYYRSLGWVSTQPAHNPTCEPVQITAEPVVV